MGYLPLLTPEDLYLPKVSIESITFADYKSSCEANKLPCFPKADFHKLYYLINRCDWSEFLACNKINVVLEKFYNTLNNIFDSCVPWKYASASNNSLWFTRRLTISLHFQDI